MCTSGLMTGMLMIFPATVPGTTLRVQVVDPTGCIVVAAGSSAPRTAVRCFATGANPPAATAYWAFALRGLTLNGFTFYFLHGVLNLWTGH